MEQRAHFFIPSILGALLLSGVVLAAGPACGEETANNAAPPPLFVQVKSVRLRSEPKHWAPGSASIGFGAQVVELSQTGDWFKVKTPDGNEGFVHSSAVSLRTVVFKGQATSAVERAESTDVVLAGKGFSSQLETAFRSGEPGLDYNAVDRLEQRVLDEGALEKFLKEGKLRLDNVERSARG